MAGTMMWVGALAVVFYSMSTLSNGLLQGIDQLKVPVINAVVSLVAHVILLIVLMLVFRMNIYAVVIANMFFALLMCVLNARAVAKHSGFRQEFAKTFFIPAFSSAIMGAVTFLLYKGSYMLLKSNTIATVLSIVVAVIVYAVVLLLCKGLTEEEIRSFPKGAALVALAKKLHLLK
jgi:stage V sporulation protein B